jgi:hypothetical protein
MSYGNQPNQNLLNYLHQINERLEKKKKNLHQKYQNFWIIFTLYITK